jgi:HD-GYP domain-containing protein (c-di-GMP phosphodiesterase class II)
VVSDSTSPRRPVLTFNEIAAPLSRRPERLHALTSAELAVAFSQAFDLAEGKPAGHAQRVCYIASALAEAIEAPAETRHAAFFGALLHDAGVTGAAAEICRIAGVDEESIFGPSPKAAPEDLRGSLPFADSTAIREAYRRHAALGADVAIALDLGEETAAAVRSHHERCDGQGFPEGLTGDEIPLAARLVSVADLAEVLIAGETSALASRRRLPQALAPYGGTFVDAELAQRLFDLARSDEFWLGLYSEDLPATLTEFQIAGETRRSRRRLARYAAVIADIADAKGAHTAGHARKTADAGEKLAEALGLDAGHVEMIRMAAMLHDVGLLGVPARVMSKPDILSVTEMQLMRQHPGNSEMVLAPLAGFEEIAFWIARHHERPDGKGYPDMLAGDDIPLESRILAIADVYAALTADRPHRGAVAADDAKAILIGAAGSQLDPELVRLFVSLI